MKRKKVGIVGANGFIGKHLTKRLAQENDLDLFLVGRGESSHEEPARYYRINPEDNSGVKKIFAGTDVLYYLASETIPASSWHSPLLEIEKNLIPFLKLLENLSACGVAKVVFLSSAGTVYGPSKEKTNEDTNKNPFSPYGITKLSMEHFLNYYKVKSGLSSDVFRISNVYGEGQDTSKGLGIINTFIEKIIDENKVTVYGDGSALRNYIYIRDVVELLLLPLRTELSSSNTFNLSSDDTLSINNIVEQLRKVAEEPFEAVYTPARQSDNAFIDLDNSKLKSHCGDFRFTPVTEGIRQTYQHIKAAKQVRK